MKLNEVYYTTVSERREVAIQSLLNRSFTDRISGPGKTVGPVCVCGCRPSGLQMIVSIATTAKL